ncbi:MAG: hypothetical protein KDB80_01000 [Planctomycetes bacterium]|nr:hypothetical protein [Planctomycetota bacterium]
MLPWTVVGAASGAAAVALALLPFTDAPRLWDQNFHIVRYSDDPFEIRADRRLSYERPLGDYDLVMEVELPPESEFDVLFHVVSPKVDDGALFHARYDALRISTEREADAFATRDRLLFGSEGRGGVRIEQGVPATVHLRVRGHRAQANVAGRKFGWFESVDDFGSVVLDLRSANSGLIHYLDLQPLARPESFARWWWGIGVGAAIGVLLGVFRARPAVALRALLALPAVAGLGAWSIGSDVVAAGSFGFVGILALSLAGLPLTIAFALGARWRGAAIACVAVLCVWELTVRLEHRRLAPFEDPRLAAYFGPDSGSITYDILSPQLRSSTAVHKPADEGPRAIFLGGAGVFDAGGRRAPQENLGPILAGQLERISHGVVVPTLFSSTAQQVALFERFLVDAFDPTLVVLGVTSDDLEPCARFTPRAVIEGDARLPDGFGSELVALWRADAMPRVPPGSPEDLHATLERFAGLARDHGFVAVIYTPESLPSEFEGVLRAEIDRHAWPRLQPRAGETTVDAAVRFAERIDPLLSR